MASPTARVEQVRTGGRGAGPRPRGSRRPGRIGAGRGVGGGRPGVPGRPSRPGSGARRDRGSGRTALARRLRTRRRCSRRRGVGSRRRAELGVEARPLAADELSDPGHVLEIVEAHVIGEHEQHVRSPSGDRPGSAAIGGSGGAGSRRARGAHGGQGQHHQQADESRTDMSKHSRHPSDQPRTNRWKVEGRCDRTVSRSTQPTHQRRSTTPPSMDLDPRSPDLLGER